MPSLRSGMPRKKGIVVLVNTYFTVRPMLFPIDEGNATSPVIYGGTPTHPLLIAFAMCLVHEKMERLTPLANRDFCKPVAATFTDMFVSRTRHERGRRICQKMKKMAEMRGSKWLSWATRERQKWKDEKGCYGLLKAARNVCVCVCVCLCELIIGLLMMIIIPSSNSIIDWAYSTLNIKI